MAIKFYKADIERFRDSTDKKPEAQIKREMKALHAYWGCYPYQYYRHHMYRSDCTLSLAEMKKYVPKFFLTNLFFPLSSKEYDILCSDKLLTYALLAAYEVPQPRFLFCYDNNTFFNRHNDPISPAEVDALIAASTAEKLFAKTRFGSEGKGIFVFSKGPDNRFIDTEQTVFSHRFFTEDARATSAPGRDSTGFYIVQEGLVQHDALNRIYPIAINTFRMMTECTNGKATLLHSVVRIGSGGHQVDSPGSGGLYIKIDKETGVLDDQAFMRDLSKHYKHPDTGFQFKGARIEAWDEVRLFTINVAEKFREIRHIGWDVALTADGCAVIELNHHPGQDFVQDCYGGIRDDLKINPKDWWYQSNYTIKNV